MELLELLALKETRDSLESVTADQRENQVRPAHILFNHILPHGEYYVESIMWNQICNI